MTAQVPEVIVTVTAKTLADLAPKAKHYAAGVLEVDSSLLGAQQRGDAVIDRDEVRTYGGTILRDDVTVTATFVVWRAR